MNGGSQIVAIHEVGKHQGQPSRRAALLVGLLCCASAPHGNCVVFTAADCPPVFFEAIGDLPGDLVQSSANDISADGRRVVGGSSADDPDVPNDGHSEIYRHAFQGFGWTRPCSGESFPGFGGPGLFGLGYPLEADHVESDAIGISPDGEVAAGFSNERAGGHRPVLWHDGGFSVLDLVPFDVTGNATAVSNPTQPPVGAGERIVVGYSHRTGPHPRRGAGARAVYWRMGNPQAIELPMPDPLGAAGAEANCVSDDGLIIGGNLYDVPQTPGALFTGRACAWYYDCSANAYQPIRQPHLPNGPDESDVYGISGNGHILVGDVSNGAGLLPCYWRRVLVPDAGPASPQAIAFDGPHVLAVLPGHAKGAATCANFSGAIIAGESDLTAAGFIGEAVRWVGFGNPERISDLLANKSISAHQSWILDSVNRISADGHTIIGNGFHPNPANPVSVWDVYEGWIARIP